MCRWTYSWRAKLPAAEAVDEDEVLEDEAASLSEDDEDDAAGDSAEAEADAELSEESDEALAEPAEAPEEAEPEAAPPVTPFDAAPEFLVSVAMLLSSFFCSAAILDSMLAVSSPAALALASWNPLTTLQGKEQEGGAYLDVQSLNLTSQLENLVLDLSGLESIGVGTASALDEAVELVCLCGLGGFAHGLDIVLMECLIFTCDNQCESYEQQPGHRE